MNLKKFYKPNRELKARNKAIFLSAFKSKFPTARQKAPTFRYFIRGVGFSAGLILLLIAGATYADQKNVGADNILYPLKRSTEAVKSIFTSGSQKAEFHLELAQRRLDEIKEIRSKNPENPKITSLSKELESEVENSIGTIEFNKNIVKKENIPPPFLPVAPSQKPGAFSHRASSTKESQTQNLNLKEIEEVGKKVSEEYQNEFKDEEVESQTNHPPNEGEQNKTENATLSTPEILNQHQTEICESWKKIIEEQDEAAVELMVKTPEIIVKFQENCRNLPNQKND
ncbi:MAG: hypothetical protein HY093_02450 [Candidatus Liptonbacteria bacterium]|nr:hypothetical protein [Candidatus Liptonbacteria bacterium]